MKKSISILIAFIIMFSCAPAFSALADTGVSFVIQPGTIPVSDVSEAGTTVELELVQVTNNTPNPITDIKIYKGSETGELLLESGNPVAAGLDLTWVHVVVGISKSDVGKSITFTLTYKEGETEKKVTTTVMIEETVAEVADIRLIREYSATQVAKGDKVKITYKLYNAGKISVDMIEVSDTLKYQHSNGSFTAISGKVFSYSKSTALAPGETITLGTLTDVVAEQSIYSDPSVKFRVGQENKALPKDPFTIKMLSTSLQFELRPSKTTVPYGTKVTLIYTIINDGNTALKDIRVYDSAGVLVQSISTLNSGADFVGRREVTISKTQDYKFLLKATDSLNKAVDQESNSVRVLMTSNSEDMMLKVEATANKTELSGPGEVGFTIKVTNDSQFPIKNVQVTNENGTAVSTIPTLEPGAQQILTFTEYYGVSAEAHFTASATDDAGKTAKFESDGIPIRLGVTPTPTPAPTETPVPGEPTPTPAPTRNTDIIGTLMTVFYIILALIAVTIGVLVYISKKGGKKGKKPVKMHRNVRG